MEPWTTTWRPLAWAVACAWAATAAAQTPVASNEALAAPGPQPAWRLQPSLTASLVLTNNAGFTSKDQAQTDVVAEVVPELGIIANGARLKVNGRMALGAQHYVNGTQADRLVPRGNVELQSTLVERLLFLDASVSAASSVSDPFVGRAEGSSGFNDVSSVRVEVSPALVYAPSPYTRFEARRRAAVTHSAGDLADDDPRRYVRRINDLLRFERQPTPLGLVLEATHEDSTYRVGDQTALDLATARATLTWALNPDLVVGVRGGRDRTRFALNEFDEPLKGVTLDWRPTPRTRLSGVAEERFFGKGGELQIDHRSPFMNLLFRLQRLPVSTTDSLGVLAPGSDLASALDSLLSSRFSNPAERAQLVQELIASRGLSPTLTQALEIFSSQPQLEQSGTLTLVLLGARHTASLTLFGSRSRALFRSSESSVALDLQDNRQEGGSVQVSRRLTPQSAVVLFVTGTRVVGLSELAERHSVSKAVRLSFDQQLGSRTSTVVGVRRQLLSSTQQPSAQETSVFGSYLHRF